MYGAKINAHFTVLQSCAETLACIFKYICDSAGWSRLHVGAHPSSSLLFLFLSLSLSLSLSPISLYLQDDRPKRRGSSEIREASGPLLLEQRSALPWAIMPSKYIAHRRLRSAINCYARRKRDRDRRRRTAAILNASLLGHLIRFASRYNVLHARYTGGCVDQP